MKVTVNYLVNEYGNDFGLEVTAQAETPEETYQDGVDAILEEMDWTEDDLYDHRGDVWDQLHWMVLDIHGKILP